MLFVVAPDLEKKVYVYASVDEADIGLIREAQTRKQPVTFTVDAYPQDVFMGRICQVRLNPTTVQNVVTYTVVVEAANARTEAVAGHDGQPVVPDRQAVPRADGAQRRLAVRPKSDRGPARRSRDAGGDGGRQAATGAGGDAAPSRDATTYVWIADGELLSAVKIATGLSDKSSTEIVSGDLPRARMVVSGVLRPAGRCRRRTAACCAYHRPATAPFSRRHESFPHPARGPAGPGEEQDARRPDRAGHRHRRGGRDPAGLDQPVGRPDGAGAVPEPGHERAVRDSRQPAGRRHPPGRGSITTLVAADADAMVAECPAVLAASPMVNARAQVVAGNQNWSPDEMFGVNANYLTIAQLADPAGRFLHARRRPRGGQGVRDRQDGGRQPVPEPPTAWARRSASRTSPSR